MADIDFSAVPALRLREAKRRAAIIEAFLERPDATHKDLVDAAALAGLGLARFYRILRVWRVHRKPELLVYGPIGKTKRVYSTDPAGKEIMRRVIAAAPFERTAADIVREVQARCERRGAIAPSEPTIRNAIRADKATKSMSADRPPVLALSRVWLKLTVRDEIGAIQPCYPRLDLAVALPERYIVSYRPIIHAGNQRDTEAVLEETLARRRPGAPGRDLLIDGDDRQLLQPMLEKAGLGDLPHAKGSVRRLVSQAFGTKLARIEIKSKLMGASRPPLLKLVGDEHALTADELAEAVAIAVAANNGQSSCPAYDLNSQ